MIRLTIKGGAEAAQAALDIRQIRPDHTSILLSKSDLGQTLTHLDTEDKYLGRVISWYTEPGQPPYPEGTLMLYSVARKQETGMYQNDCTDPNCEVCNG